MMDIKEFGKSELRVGTIVSAELFPEAKQAAYKLVIDFGPHGKRRSSAQITDLYSTSDLEGTQVVAVMNLAPKKIAGFISEVLVLGAARENGAVELLRPDRSLPNGSSVS
jgi:tRNA-binding protein